MIKNSFTVAILLFLWFMVNLLFLDPLQCFVYLLFVGVFTWIVARFRYQTIMRQHGSFQNYIEGLDTSDKYVRTVTELTKKFSWLGRSSARILLLGD